MAERRTRQFMVSMTPTERDILQRLSERDGSSGADVLRRLLLNEARRRRMAPQSPRAGLRMAPATTPHEVQG